MTDTQNSTELLPCPWCGEHPRLDRRQTQSLWSSDEATFSLVICDECEVSGKDFCDDPDGEEAIDWWNSRAQPAKSAACAKSQVGVLPADLNWDRAPPRALALIGGKIDDLHPDRKLFVWVSDTGRQTMGVLALPFDGRPAGSQQSAALDSLNSGWVVLATRPAAQAVKLPMKCSEQTRTRRGFDFAQGWNESREATAKLNGIEP